MVDDHDEYTEEEWEASAGHHPLRDTDVNVRLLLHRQWIWADFQKRRMGETLAEAPRPDDTEAFLVHEAYAAMYLWYSLLYSVIEGFTRHRVELKGPWKDDLRAVRENLRLTRHAVFHMAEKYWDDRLFSMMQDPDSVARIYRIHNGFARLFLQDPPPA